MHLSTADRVSRTGLTVDCMRPTPGQYKLARSPKTYNWASEMGHLLARKTDRFTMDPTSAEHGGAITNKSDVANSNYVLHSHDEQSGVGKVGRQESE